MKELKNNRFHTMRKELAKISKEKNVDIDAAISMLAQERGFEDWGKEAMEFKTFLADLGGENYKAYFTD